MAIITKSDPEDISLSTTGAWTDCDASTISGYTSSVTGVIVRVINTGSSNWTWGLRKNGSTDDRRASTIVGNTPGTHLMMAVGVDASGIFEGWIQNTNVDFEIVAFLTGDTFFTNMVDKSTGTTSAWVDFDISSDTGGDTATWAWVEWNIVGASAMGLRCNGSTDDRRALSWRKNAGGCKVDGSELGEQYIAATSTDLFLAGYGTAASSQITAHTNATDRSTATTGSYETITSPDASAIAAFYDVYTTTATAGSFSIRRSGSSVDSYRDLYLRAHWAVTLSATGGTAEQKIETTDVDVFELMYWTAAAASSTIGFPRIALTGAGMR